MCALRRYAAVYKHNNFVCKHNLAYALRYEQRCCVLQRVPEAFPYLALGRGIHRARAVIHNKDGRVLDHRPCNAQPLLLAA